MENKAFKYANEAGLTFHLEKFVMCQRDEFAKYESSPYHFQFLADCNLYFICQRPRITLLPNSLQATEKSIQLTFQFWEGDNKHDFPIVFDNKTGSINLKTVSKYPHSFFKILDENENEVYSAKTTYVADDKRKNIFPNPDFLDFEILYIGKALDNSSKPTFNRLVKHETLSEICSEILPDKEIFLFLYPLFDVSGDIEIRGTIETQKEYEEEDEKRLKKFLTTGLNFSYEQQIAVAEAALIKYFQPKYNDHHKKTFPTKRNPSYNELYKMDFNSVTIEVDTTKIETMPHFFTEEVKSSQIHSQSFFLPTESDRRKLFDDFTDFDNH